MDLHEAKQIALNKMQEHGLTNWYFEFSDTQHRGDYDYNKKRIRISESFTIANTIDRVTQTILHEIAHALTWINNRNAKPHGIEWQTIAKSIGHTGQRFMSAEYYETKRQQNKSYIGTCPNCKRQITRTRRDTIACTRCCKKYNNGKYNAEFLFTWQEKLTA